MDFCFVPMTAAYAQVAAMWRYPGALCVYDQPSAEGFLLPGYYAALDINETMVGFACLGEDARVAGYPYAADAVDIGLGMCPDMLGRGLGSAYVSAVVSLARDRHPGADVRLTVAEWNARAITVYTKVGFEWEGAFSRSDGARFVVMRRREAAWVDVTMTLRAGMPVYPGDPSFEVSDWATHARDGCRVSQVVMGAHTGTHVDAPEHFIPGGMTVDRLSPALLCGAVQLITVSEVSQVEEDERRIECALMPGIRRVLLKTGNAVNGGLSLAEAESLVRRGIRLVGVDSLSVAPKEQESEVHTRLLDAGVVIVEGLALGDVPDGVYEMVCLPLKIAGGEAAPARVMLRAMP